MDEREQSAGREREKGDWMMWVRQHVVVETWKEGIREWTEQRDWKAIANQQ